ncbi:hypothetical protein ABZP36_007673 [Zizania latifolia]
MRPQALRQWPPPPVPRAAAFAHAGAAACARTCGGIEEAVNALRQWPPPPALCPAALARAASCCARPCPIQNAQRREGEQRWTGEGGRENPGSGEKADAAMPPELRLGGSLGGDWGADGTRKQGKERTRCL